MTINKDIKTHMARAFFASAWADACEESGNAGMMSGRQILDIMPDEIDPAAVRAAEDLFNSVMAYNGTKDAAALMRKIADIQAGHDEYGDRPLNAEMLGHYLAMQAMGHGVGLYDAFGRAVYGQIHVPCVEFGEYSLDRDYF